MVAHLECLKFISIRMRLKEQICVHTHMFGIGLNFFVSSLFILLLVNETQCLFKYMGTFDNENNFFFFVNFAMMYGFNTQFLTKAMELGLIYYFV